MKEFATAQIRNVALVAHHGVGKTSLAEAMLFNAKATTRLGRIADGTTLLDHAPDEISRQITIDLGLAQFEWAGHKVNLLDTPGYPDFVGDVYSALRVADAAVLLLRGSAGVEMGTEVRLGSAQAGEVADPRGREHDGQGARELRRRGRAAATTSWG